MVVRVRRFDIFHYNIRSLAKSFDYLVTYINNFVATLDVMIFFNAGWRGDGSLCFDIDITVVDL